MGVKALLFLLILQAVMPLPAQTIFPQKSGGLFGYIDTTGKWVIAPQFTQAGPYLRNKAIATRRDSLFMVYQKGTLVYLPGLRNYSHLNGGYYAVQNRSGKWALADSLLGLLSDFTYTRIESLDTLFRVQANGFWGLADARNRSLLPCRFSSVSRLSNGNFRAYEGLQVFIYKLKDSMQLLLDGRGIVYDQKYPKIYRQTDKKSKLTLLYGLDGDSLYSCRSCEVKEGLGHFIFLQTKAGVHMLDVVQKKIRMTLSGMGEVMVRHLRPGYIYVRSTGELFSDTASEPFLKLDSGADSICFASERYFYIRVNGLWGLIDRAGKSIVPPRYQVLTLTDERFAEAATYERKHLYSLEKGKCILSTRLYANISADSTSILVYHAHESRLYEMDADMNLSDSGVFKNMIRVNAGRKVPLSSAGNGFAGMGNRNTSLSLRWFQNKGYFGLLGFAGDTLLKPYVVSVSAINDSLDVVSYRARMTVLKVIEGKGAVYTDELYGIVNNRNGHFLIKPSFGFIDLAQFADTAFKVVRVANRSGIFSLMNKNDFSLVEGSSCSYISPATDGYMRLFYRARFIGADKELPGNLQEVPHFLSFIFQFSEFGKLEVRNNNKNRVFMYAAAANIATKEGTLKWGQETARMISFAESARHQTLIASDHRNRFGVVHADKGIIVPFEYSLVSRLPGDDRYFVLQHFNLKYGYVNLEGRELTDAVYSEAQAFKDQHAWAKKGDSMLLLDTDGQALGVGLGNVRTGVVSEEITSYKVRKGWILMDVSGKRISEEVFRQVRPFVKGTAAVMINGHWGLINSNGDWVLPAEFDDLAAENAESLVFTKGRKHCFFTRNGEEFNRIKAKGQISTLGRYYYCMNQKSGKKIYHSNGQALKNKRFLQDLRAIGDTVAVLSNFRMVLWSPAGKRIKSYKHQGGVRAFDKGALKPVKFRSDDVFLKLNISESQRFLNRDVFGDSLMQIRLLKPQFQQAVLVNLKIAECMRNNAFIYEYKNGPEQKLYCLSDSLGNLLIETQFLKLECLDGGLYRATLRNENGSVVMGILNKEGLWVLPPKFKKISDFKADIATYAKENDFLIADGNGRLITEQIFVDYRLQDGYYCLSSEDQTAWWHPGKGWLAGFSK